VDHETGLPGNAVQRESTWQTGLPGNMGENVKSSVIPTSAFKIFDEAGREIDMEDHLAKKVKVNWTPRLIKDLVIKGGLPDIKIPTSASDTKYCHISINGTGVDFSFTIK
jgi:hypothetical protein